MADAAARLAAELADLKRRIAAMERGQQFAHTTLDVDGEAIPVPDAITQGVEANALSHEALAASTELDTRLTTAETDLTESAARLAQAESDIVDAFGAVEVADAKAVAAQADADDALAEAEAASAAAVAADAKADDAATAAAEAAGIADSKGKVLIQSTAPVAADRNAVTLWIDTTGGANTPKRWTGSTWAAVTDKAATDAAQAAVAAQSAAEAADAKAVAAQTAADAADAKAEGADAKAAAAQTAASTAQTAADNAHTAADDAAQAAADAAGIANGKGKALIQSTAPAVADRNAVTLWIDTTGGANTPKRWSGSAWVAVTDKAATDAATAAANAASAAAAADAKAVAAQTAAGTAQSTADNALTMAGSKGKVYYDTTTPSGTGTAAGDLWRRVDSSKNVIGEWYWTGSVWQTSQITTSAISNLDVGKLTVGTAAILTATAQKIAASTASFQTVDVKNLFVTSGTLDTAVIDKLWADVVNSRKITTGMLLVGRGSNLINWIPGDTSLFVAQSGGGGTTFLAVSDSDAGGAAVRVDAPGVTPGTFAYTTEISSGTTAPNGQANAYEIEPGAAYRLQMRATFGGTVTAPATTQPTLRFMVRFFNGSNASLGDVQYTAGAGKAAYAGALVTWEGKAPADAVAARIYIQQDQPTSATGQLYLSLFGFYKKTSSVLIEDGAVTADKLEARLVLTNEVIAGDPAGNHAKLDQTGFRVMAPPVDGAEPTEVIRLGTDTDDYFGVVGADGNLTASITSEGGISGQRLAIADSITLGGTDLGDRLDLGPKGLVAWASRWSQGTYYAGITKHPYLHLQVDGIKGGRAYKVRTGPIQLRSDTAESNAAVYLHVGPGTRAATVDDPVYDFALSVQNPWTTGDRSAVSFDRLITPSSDAPLSFLLSYGIKGNTGRCRIIASTDNPVIMTVEDIGVAVPETGEWRNGTSDASPGGTQGGESTAPTTKKNYDQTWNATGIRSYTGAGATYSYNTGYMYSGLSPAGYGDLSSIAVFPSLTSTLSGATISDIWVYVYYDFWYYGNGGNAAISLHGQSSLPSTRPTLSFSLMSNGWPRAAGRWVRLPDSTYAGFKSGSWKGFALGAHGGGYTEYGYAHDPKIRIKYTK